MSKIKYRVLNALEKENYISGEQIAQQLEISRTSVWKAIKSLKEAGYQINAITNKGYQLVKSPNKIHAAMVESVISKHAFVDKVFYLDAVDSTQNYAMNKHSEIDGSFIVIANEQNKGRGRFNRSWLSPAQSGLYMSIVLRANMPLSEIGKFNFHVSLAIARTISNELKLDAKIKWPNDVYINGKKVCGFLTEIISESGIVDTIICGIGINTHDSQHLEAVPTATSIEKELDNQHVPIEKFFEALIVELKHAFEDFKNSRFNEILDEWLESSNIFQRELTINTYNESYRAKALSIDETGFLNVVDNEGNIKKVISADIELN